ncbi:cytochrome c-550 PedF [Aestuariibius sp. 2305UL40-4]|uniref:cytochrome c-550 PedF n=1 Tax=Aestuariibius violaceus TaxID=3234132 RepID=UPI00345EE671
MAVSPFRFAAWAVMAGMASGAFAAGPPVTPQAVDTTGLPELGDEWLIENPYRAETAGEDVWERAIEIGASGYNQNCARCHGIEGVSGGLAPDLRFLEAEEYGDEWYAERFVNGYTQGGVTKMPEFGDLLGQEAAWAIRTYIETRPDDQAIADNTDALKALRDQMAEASETDAEAVRGELIEIAEGIETLSGAPIADSIARRAALVIDGSPEGFKEAAETLTIGLSAAQ